MIAGAEERSPRGLTRLRWARGGGCTGIWHWSADHPRIKIVVHSVLPSRRTGSHRPDRAAPTGSTGSTEHGPPTDVAADEPAPLSLERASSTSASASRCTACERAARVRRAARRSSRSTSATSSREESSRTQSARSARTRRRCTFPLACSRAGGRSSALGARWPARVRPGQVHGRSREDEGRAPRGLPRVARLDFQHLLLAHGEPVARRGTRGARRLRSLTRTRERVLGYPENTPESFERQLGDRVTKRLKSPSAASGSGPFRPGGER